MRVLVGMIFTFAGLTAHAEGANKVSEYFWQPDAGKHEMTIGLNYSATKVDLKTGGLPASVEFKETTVNIGYGFGFNDVWAFGADLNYTTGKQELGGAFGTGSTDEKGLEDIELSARANRPAGDNGSIHYGVILNLSPGDAEKSATGDENKYSGGHSLGLNIGYQRKMDTCVFGVDLATNFGLGDRNGDDKTNTPSGFKEKGGNETSLNLFYEHTFSEQSLLGAVLAYKMKTEETKTSGGVSTKSDGPNPIYDLSVIYRHQVGNGYILPRLTYSMSTDKKIKESGSEYDLDDFTRTAFDLAYRMEF